MTQTVPGARRRPVMLMAALGTAAALAIGIAAGAWWKSSTATAAVEWSATRLGGPSTAMQPVLSPDGQLLAFQTIVDGQSQIAVMKPGGGTWRVLTSDRSRGPIEMHDWSPDGSRIFYDRQTDSFNGIFSVPALGGDKRLVLENAAYPAALPDGDLLVMRVNANRQTQLHRFSPSTGRVDPLPALAETNGRADAVVASRDGRRVYFFERPSTGAPSAAGVFELDLRSKQTRPVAGTMNLRSPVSMSSQPGTAAIFVGGLDGDAFRMVRFSAATTDEPRTVLLLPGAARFDIATDGTVYLGLRTRPVELFVFRAGAPAAVPPERVSGLSLPRGNTLQIIAPLPDGGVLIGTREGDRDRRSQNRCRHEAPRPEIRRISITSLGVPTGARSATASAWTHRSGASHPAPPHGRRDRGIVMRRALFVLRYGIRPPNLSRIQMSEVGFRWAYISRVPSGESRNARTVSQ